MPTATKKAISKKTTKAPAKSKAKIKKVVVPEKRMSALDAAFKVLSKSGEPMNAQAMVESMSTNGYWTSPGGKTPHATLYAAILREINLKGDESRFVKKERGLFAAR